jgi:hypothetical protein
VLEGENKQYFDQMNGTVMSTNFKDMDRVNSNADLVA